MSPKQPARPAPAKKRPSPRAAAAASKLERPTTLQDLILALERYWAQKGCLIHQPWDAEVGAGTMHPETFLRVLGPAPWKVGYVQPSRRPADGRYGDNPNRLYKHQQYQVILKPPPADIQDQYLGSLMAMGIDPSRHDVRFEEDNWESPTLGAWGIGWQVLLDGQEITQFTYFQQAGGIDLSPISGEITYGLERIAMYLQDVDNVYDLAWAPGVRYRDVRHEEEYQLSRYSFELADATLHRELFERYLGEGWRLLGAGETRAFLAAYDWCLKSSHAFNVLDARGAISVSERAGLILKIRKLACAIAAACVAGQGTDADGANAALGEGGLERERG
jgi:glycyl-tRNA synthetase alpha chain